MVQPLLTASVAGYQHPNIVLSRIVFCLVICCVKTVHTLTFSLLFIAVGSKAKGLFLFHSNGTFVPKVLTFFKDTHLYADLE